MECAALNGGEMSVAWLLMEEREERKHEIKELWTYLVHCALKQVCLEK